MVLRKGFTLIEILVVITIIGILAGIVGASYIPTQKRARDGKRKADLELVRSGLEMYRADQGSYPIGTGSIDVVLPGGYVTIPSDPSGGVYSYSGSASTYRLCAYLETLDIGTWQCGPGADCGGSGCNYEVNNP